MNSKLFSERALKRDCTTSQYLRKAEVLAVHPHLIRALNGALGACGEAGELADIVKRTVFYGQPLDAESVKEEVGDILWYLNVVLDSVGSCFDEAMAMNDDKLSKRYPDGFTETLAAERSDKK
jgi:NTP pyrophosphatase (non-canonical NTP hydrolase)